MIAPSERISRIEPRTLSKLRHPSRPHELPDQPEEAWSRVQGGRYPTDAPDMASLADKIRPVVLLEQGERLLGASYARSVSGPTVGPSVVAVSDRRLFVAPRSAFLSTSAWTRRQVRDLRLVAAPRSVLGVVVGRRFELLGQGSEAMVFELQGRKDVAAFRGALGAGAAT